jgi:hypothetical protein
MEKVEAITLALAVEDRYALYEVLGELGFQLPALTAGEVRSKARAAILSFARRRLVEVLHREVYPEPPNDCRATGA